MRAQVFSVKNYNGNTRNIHLIIKAYGLRIADQLTLMSTNEICFHLLFFIVMFIVSLKN